MSVYLGTSFMVNFLTVDVYLRDCHPHHRPQLNLALAKLKYHKILKTDKKGVASILWIKDCPFPFTLDRPLKDTETWAGILYRQGMPWVLYSTSNKREKDSWRKI